MNDIVFLTIFFLVQDTEKTLKSLKSNSQPMVKKRQLMQLAFGDYRRKMADEEKKLRVGQYRFLISISLSGREKKNNQFRK